AALWQALPEELRLSPHRYLATNSPQGPWWVLGWCERVTGLITRITTPDGRASAFYYNHHNQLTSATGPDGLE
ncbi:hypothetical protein ACM2U8_24670, partial [Escherichia coli]